MMSGVLPVRNKERYRKRRRLRTDIMCKYNEWVIDCEE